MASSRVLSHRVPITVEAGFCVEALEEALSKRGGEDWCRCSVTALQ
jgi:hypothetical protein